MDESSTLHNVSGCFGNSTTGTDWMVQSQFPTPETETTVETYEYDDKGQVTKRTVTTTRTKTTQAQPYKSPYPPYTQPWTVGPIWNYC